MSFLAPDHPDYLTAYGPAIDRIADPASCPRCGQQMIADATVCDPCRALEREPQGEPLPLFTMAPAVRAPQPEGLFS